MQNGEKRFPYSWPELVYMALVMVMPFVVVWLWPAQSFLGMAAHFALGMLGGVVLWFGMLAAALALQVRKEKKQSRSTHGERP